MLDTEHRASIVYVQAMCMMRSQFAWGLDTDPEPCPIYVAKKDAELRAAAIEAGLFAGE
jgi:hypothetical protein